MSLRGLPTKGKSVLGHSTVPSGSAMYIEKFFTEYDDDVSSQLNLDPLGLQVIWSAYGQEIFKNRISSISNDVRNYTLNLFHHHIVRTVVVTMG
jgi:hypothetical protein